MKRSMSLFRRGLAVVALGSGVLFGGSTLAVAAPFSPEPQTDAAAVRLAASFTDDVRDILKQGQLTMESVDAAFMLMTRVVELTPEDPQAWQLMTKVAALVEDRAMRVEATRQLVRLDPKNQVAQLARILQEGEPYQTVEERISYYERLLRGSNEAKLNSVLGSRVAFELALMHRRAGNTESFAEYLAESVALDSSNRKAAALAAGYFRSQVDDPLAEIELFCGLLMADPTDLRVADELASLLLQHGAYEGAERVYAMAVAAREMSGVSPSSDVLADWALAAWGRNDPDKALRIIARRQQEMTALARNRARILNPGMSIDDLVEVTGELTPALAAVRLAIHERTNSEFVPSSLFAIRRAYEVITAQMLRAQDDPETPNPSDEMIAARHLEILWLVLWLGNDVREADSEIALRLDEADRLVLRTDESRGRVDGWLAYRSGDYAAAMDILEPLAEADVPSRLGLGLAQIKSGQQRSGARNLLSVIREKPGTLMAVWTGEVLAELLGQRLPISEEAEKVETLMASVPRSIDRFPNDPTTAVSMRVVPTSQSFGPFEPITLDVHLRNNSMIPLAIGPEGPIRPQVVIEPKFRVSGVGNSAATDPQPLIIDMDERLRLEPGETLTVRVDIRQSDLGTVFRRYRIRGGFVRMRAAFNFIALLHPQTGRPVFQPGLLGAEQLLSPIRVEGVVRVPSGADISSAVTLEEKRSLAHAWVDELLATLSSPASLGNAETIVLLALHLADPSDPTVELFAADPSGLNVNEQARRRAEIRSRQDAAAPVLGAAFRQLDPLSQAWVLTEIMPSGASRPMLQAARESLSSDVVTAYLLRMAEGDDPFLTSSLQSTDPLIRTVATAVYQMRASGVAPELQDESKDEDGE